MRKNKQNEWNEKENNGVKRVEVDAVTSFIKFYEVESFSDAEVYTDDDDYESEKDGVNEFR